MSVGCVVADIVVDTDLPVAPVVVKDPLPTLEELRVVVLTPRKSRIDAPEMITMKIATRMTRISRRLWCFRIERIPRLKCVMLRCQTFLSEEFLETRSPLINLKEFSSCFQSAFSYRAISAIKSSPRSRLRTDRVSQMALQINSSSFFGRVFNLRKVSAEMRCAGELSSASRVPSSS
jgi:hypothetical protein